MKKTRSAVVPLKLPGYVWLNRLIINLFKDRMSAPRSLDDEKYGEPGCTIVFRERGMSAKKAASFPDQEMYDSITTGEQTERHGILQNISSAGQDAEFRDELRTIGRQRPTYQRHDSNRPH